MVLQSVPPHTTAAGVPARIVGKPESDKPAMDMDQHFNGIHHTFEYGDGISIDFGDELRIYPATNRALSGSPDRSYAAILESLRLAA